MIRPQAANILLIQLPTQSILDLFLERQRYTKEESYLGLGSRMPLPYLATNTIAIRSIISIRRHRQMIHMMMFMKR
jgi:hypothetical protein